MLKWIDDHDEDFHCYRLVIETDIGDIFLGSVQRDNYIMIKGVDVEARPLTLDALTSTWMVHRALYILHEPIDTNKYSLIAAKALLVSQVQRRIKALRQSDAKLPAEPKPLPVTNVADQPVMGLAEIAMYRGVSKQTVSNWRKRNMLFPDPHQVLSSGPIWMTETIVEFFKDK